MNRFRISTPEGTRDLLFSSCRALRQTENAVRDALEERGYSEIITPAVEYFDVFAQANPELDQDQMLKIIDKSGRICVARPDNTTPIARIAATRLDDAALPVRLYYSQKVFRSVSGDHGHKGEFLQVGAEFIGADGLEADKDILTAAFAALSKTGADNFRVELGHAEIYKALMDELEVEIAGIQKEREELEADRKSLDDDKAALEPLRQEAEDNARRLEQVCKEIERDEMTLAEKVADAKRKQEALDAEAAKVQELLDQSNYEGKYSKMYWPVPAVKNISSGFGYRWGSMHKGIDISEGAVPVYGQSIYAAADGVVLYTVTSGWGGGFGLHVVIDHGYDANGKRISTRYAHCSQVLVSPGQVVKGGETIIGKVGDTGDVTGPHLHFEVMEGGVLDQVDPVANGYVPNYRNGVIVG